MGGMAEGERERGTPAGAALAGLGAALAEAVTAAVPGWVVRSVEQRAAGSADPALRRAAEDAGRRAAAEVGPRLDELLTADVDQQWTNPLAIVRDATRYPTEVLWAAGVAPVPRDDDDRARFPDDVYDLVPRSFADVDPALVDLGVAWGASKAHAHLARHRGSPGGGA